MATFGISIPDEIKEELDRITEGWYTDRSKAFVRIFQEWKQTRQAHLSIIHNSLNSANLIDTSDSFPPVVDTQKPKAA